MKIPLHLLETFATFARRQNLVDTAQALKTTQPTVTRHLQEIQTYFSVPLFVTKGRRKHLTETGQVVADNISDQLLHLGESLLHLQRSTAFLDELRLTIGGRAELLQKYAGNKRFPFGCELVSMSRHDAELALKRKDLDIAILQSEVVSDEYVRRKLFQDQFVIIAPPPWGLSELGDKPQASYVSEGSFQKALLVASGVNPTRPAEFVFSDWPTLENRVHQGLEWAVVPSSYVRERPNYQILFTDRSSVQTFWIYYRKSFRRFPWFKEIENHFLESKTT